MTNELDLRGRTPSAAHQQTSRPLQRRVGNRATVQLLASSFDADAVERVLRSSGSALDSGFRGRMEQAYGADFSSVRVHTGAEANLSAQRLAANAYTMGEHIVFADGAYDTGSSAGQHTLAHELAHVVQQRSGPVHGVQTESGLFVNEPGDPFERAADTAATAALSVQREVDDDYLEDE